jgi:hypothetical protein
MPDADTCTKALNGRWYGSYGVAFCPAHDNCRPPARRARMLWAAAGPIEGTLAEPHLRSRAIRQRRSPSLRFLTDCSHPRARMKLPAKLAVVYLHSDMVTVHRTYLADTGAKAPVEPQKAMLAPVKGGAARLSDGTGPLVVAEGLETSLPLCVGLVPVTYVASASRANRILAEGG